MKLFELGSHHELFFDDSTYTGTIIYNNGDIAIVGFNYIIMRKSSYDYNWEHDPFAMTKEEIAAFVPDFEYSGPYNCFVVVDLESRCLIKLREWFRRNDALFLLGKEYHSAEEWDCYIGNTVTVYRFNGIAVIKVFDGEGRVYDALKRYGYNKEEVCSVFPAFKDDYPVDCSDFFYLCVRESDDSWVDLNGNSIDENIYNSL